VVLLALIACQEQAPAPIAEPPPACQPLRIQQALAVEEDFFERDYPGNRGPGVALADFDGDGWIDLFWARPTDSVLYRNDGAGGLVVSDSYDSANGASGVDVDSDGDVDVLLTTDGTRPLELLRNRGDGVFDHEVFAEAVGHTKTASWGDVDGDGLVDLFVSGFIDDARGEEIASGEQVGDGNRLYRQTSVGVYEEDALALPTAVFDALTYEGVFADFDLDGDLDLYLVNDHGKRFKPNKLLLNDGTGSFTAAENCACELDIAGMGGDAQDLTGDGRPDILMSDDGSVHLLEDDGRLLYVDTALARGLHPDREGVGVGWAAEVADVDMDTWPDVLMAYGSLRPLTEPDRNHQSTLHLNNGDLTWRDARGEAGFASIGIGRSVTLGDLDRDARADIVVSGIEFLEVWMVRGGCGPAVTVELDGGEGNPHGLGARVDATAGARRWTVWHDTASTYSSSAPELYLGLGDAETLDLVVTWVDGTTTELSGAERGSTHVVAR